MANQHYHNQKGKPYEGNQERRPNNPQAKESLDLDKAVRLISPLLNMEQLSTNDISIGVEEIRKSLEYAGSDYEFTTHQIRNIYTMIKNCRNHNELIINRPRLAYLGVRQKTKKGKEIVTLVDMLIQKVQNESQLNGLIYIVESMVAYHKFYSKAN
jgi:CRISPR type III-A-associated protein Csm2